ncbi:MAG TPA: tyrosine-protein phosphatase [Thermomicrobiales bacterium]|nr:tyrosine-protein phosphatase [Thermomicrobiales bacterium]
MTDPTTMNASELDPREWALEGATNFRDLGGLVNRHGQVVRRHRVFRSDALARLTPVDLDRLAGVSIRTLIDLRSPIEIAQTGPSPLVGRGTSVVHAPVMDVDASPEALDDKPLAEMYAAFLVQGEASYRTVFSTLATRDDLPAVIHCAAGKDRTGVAVALLLRLLEVDDALIVDDYAITDRNMRRMIQGWMESNPELASRAEGLKIPEQLIRAQAETMATFLVTLDATYGSAEGYLRAAGVGHDEIAAIRDALLA